MLLQKTMKSVKLITASCLINIALVSPALAGGANEAQGEIEACEAVLAACDEAVSAADAVIEEQRALIAQQEAAQAAYLRRVEELEKKQHSILRNPLLWFGVGLAAGAVGGTVLGVVVSR